MTKNISTITLFILMLSGHLDSMAQLPENIKLKDYRPKSIYKITVSKIPKAKYPVIDVHSHTYATSDAGLAQWVKIMDKVGVEKTIILTMYTGAKFDSVYTKYAASDSR